MKLKYSLFALIALAVSGCQKAPVYDDVVYIAGAEGEVPTLSLTLDDQFPKELSVKVSSSIVVGHDTKVRLVTDPSKIEEYNTQYGKKGVMLPETNFVLKNTELTIPAGSFSTAEPLVVSVTKDEGLKEGVSYVIPLSIESVDGDLKVKEGFRTVFVEIGRIIIGPAADCSGSTYFKVDFAEGEQDKYDIYNLGEVTYEARINLQRWGGWCNTVMGLEENFCLRFVQDDFKGQLQLSGWGGTLMVPTGGIAVSLNKWTHVAAVFDGPNKKVSIYIDGVLACSADTQQDFAGPHAGISGRLVPHRQFVQRRPPAEGLHQRSPRMGQGSQRQRPEEQHVLCRPGDGRPAGILALQRKSRRQKGGRRPDRTRIQGDLLQLGHEMGGQRPLSRMTTDVIRTTNKLPFRAACLFFRFPASDYSKRPRTRRSHNGLSASLTSSSTCTK